MLWCYSMRPKVVHENPQLDFGSISKRLGEIWQALSEKDKMVRDAVVLIAVYTCKFYTTRSSYTSGFVVLVGGCLISVI